MIAALSFVLTTCELKERLSSSWVLKEAGEPSFPSLAILKLV